MENGLSTQVLRHPALVLASLPDRFRMQLGPFNPQIQDVKGLALDSVTAFRLSRHPGFPVHLLNHLPQLFPTVDPRSLPFAPGAFRPFNLPPPNLQISSLQKTYPHPSAFAPPVKTDPIYAEKGQDLSPGGFGQKTYDEDDSGFRSPSEREMDPSNCDLNGKSNENPRGPDAITPPKTTPIGNQREENENNGSKIQFDPTCCPICGQLVLVGEVERHFCKEVERLNQLESLSRERKYLLEKVHPCFGNFSNGYGDENGIPGDGALPRGRWETYQRIKSNRLSRLRIKNKRRRNGDAPSCPVCNEKLQGSVEDVNLHVEHCLKKAEEQEDQEENIDVEGDSDSYGDYEWAGRHLARATTSFLVGGIAAGLLPNGRKPEKVEEEISVDVDDGRSSVVSHNQESQDLNMEEENEQQDFLPKPSRRGVVNGN